MKRTFLLSLVCLFHLSSFAQPGKPALRIRHLVDSFYTYVSYGEYNGQNYPANAMYMVTDGGVVLFDTPWGEVYYQALLDSIQIRHGKKVVICISTHYHEDRTGGLTYYTNKGIETYTTRLTDSLSVVNKQNRASHHFTGDTTFTIGGHSFEAFYPGPGHTQDNIVLWFPKEKILYGGCFIKSASDKDLGNLNSANVKEWGNSIHRLQNHIGKPAYIIVGHNDFTNLNSLTHTLQMVRTYNASHKSGSQSAATAIITAMKNSENDWNKGDLTSFMKMYTDASTMMMPTGPAGLSAIRDLYEKHYFNGTMQIYPVRQ